jgi:probable F420-dependent oxidoreductase
MTNLPTLSLSLRTFDTAAHPDWSRVRAQAVAADEAGIDRLVISDHVVLGERLDVHHETGGGTFPTGPDGAWLEAQTVMTYLAAATSTARLASGVLIVPLRRPAVLAKSLATLDVLSGGRVDLGVGVGWQREEYEAAGVPFHRRGRLLDEALEICTALWTQRPASYRSDNVQFESIWCEPKPLQPGGVPIWVAGRLIPATVNRIVRWGTGWIPWGEYRADIVWAMEELCRRLDAGGRDPSTVLVRHDLPLKRTADGAVAVEGTLAPLESLVGIGVTDFRLLLGTYSSTNHFADDVSRFVKAFRARVDRPT